MKKIKISLIVFLLIHIAFPVLSISNQSIKTFGKSANSVDLNLNCTGIRGDDGSKKIGYKNIYSKNKSKKILISLTKAYNDFYGWPESVVINLGPNEFEGVKYESLQISFEHSKKKLGDNYFVFRKGLLKNGDEYLLTNSFIRADKEIINKLETFIQPMDSIINYNKSVDDYIELMERYTDTLSEYIFTNLKTNIYKVNLYRCKSY